MNAPGTDKDRIIAFQGERGAYSHMAAESCYPDRPVLPCPGFEAALEAVANGEAGLAMIPIENSTAGRVADIHLLLPGSGLFIVGEHFAPIRHNLMALPGADEAGLTTAISHVQALDQCRKTLRGLGLHRQNVADTAGAARLVAESGDTGLAAVASELAAQEYGLTILRRNIQDEGHNTTRFVVLSRTPLDPATLTGPTMTSFTFEVRNVPAALYKALGGFATNGVNMTKLESYYEGDSFMASEFYADIEGDERDSAVRRAMEELNFHTKRINVLGTYAQERRRTLTD
ncbi:prephenate dehydratase [Yunchengibacter salinarum]|uniref:prephenate dehydratase n=1 Tax=Yunchengibacter salinarum TaxID=3133399 RepID=UPI0035B5984A